MSMRHLVASALVLVFAAALARPADAIPVFAHRYGLTCQACHTEIPHLTAFGEQFLARGYRIPGLAPKTTLPVAVKGLVSYSSGTNGGDADASTTGKLPKTTVAEVELLVGGSAGPRTSYWAESYLVDGGFPGRVRDLWVSERVSKDNVATPVVIRAGQATLDLPVDPETFRETSDPYAIYSLNGFHNPFTLFEPKIGVSALIGTQLRGTSATLSLLQGREAGSNLPVRGLDRSLYVQQVRGDFTLSGYRYDGTRFVDGADDRFWRQGYGVGWAGRGTRVDAVYQTGFDTRADQFADALFSSGGFVQVRQDVGARTFAVARWDATQGDNFTRATTVGLGYRPRRNMRLTAFDSMKFDPVAQHVQHTFTTQLLFAY
jgi:hypothetical protein